MKYEKPLIVHSTNAVFAIQGNLKESGDGDIQSPDQQTLPAYEADE